MGDFEKPLDPGEGEVEATIPEGEIASDGGSDAADAADAAEGGEGAEGAADESEA